MRILLLDVGGDDVGFFVEWNENVFAFNSGTIDLEVHFGASDVVKSNGAAFQEFLLNMLI